MDRFAASYDRSQGVFGDEKKKFVVFPLVFKLLRKLQPRTVLDVGCGNGSFGRYCSLQGLEMDGLDRSEALIEKARLRDANFGQSRNYFVVDAANLDRRIIENYEVFVCLFSLQDMSQPQRFLATIRKHCASPTAIIFVNESYFHLTNRLVEHSVARTIRPCSGFDEANFLSTASWGENAESLTYCRLESTYKRFTRLVGLDTLEFGYFGNSPAPINFLNYVWPSTKPFYFGFSGIRG